MFGLGMGELLVIMAIALIFLGPKRLPDVATSLGKAIRSFRKATRDLTSQLEIDEDVKAPLRELQSALRDEPAPVRPLAMTPNAAATPNTSTSPISPPAVTPSVGDAAPVGVAASAAHGATTTPVGPGVTPASVGGAPVGGAVAVAAPLAATPALAVKTPLAVPPPVPPAGKKA
jgi:Tat protein translocase TatB subunit